MRFLSLFQITSVALVMLLPMQLLAAEVHIAVAANFTAPMKVIAQAFEKETGHQTKVSYGATGQFYAQIKNGAPFAVLLAADESTPARLVQEGLAVNGSAFTYAKGRLVLWSLQPNLVDAKGEILRSSQIGKVAIANPKLAPYGAAAMQVIESLGLREALVPKLVEGSHIGQAYQFVSSGNAPLGFVALSQVTLNGKITAGSGWVVPADLHTPILQNAVLLRAGVNNPAAKDFIHFLRTDQAKKVIRSFGYE
jgi:molybdate transport system substrate-binding protein